MILADQLKALKGKLNAENDLGGQKDTLKIAELEQQIADLNIQILAETQALEAEARVQEQEEKVESIKLPYDFNVVLDEPRANDMILELLKDMRRQDFADHNNDIAKLMESHREELRAATDRELQLKRQNDELQASWEERDRTVNIVTGMLEQEKADHAEEAEAHEKTLSMLNETKLRLNDAESKRDAAVREKEGIELLLTEKQAQIDKLRDEIAIGAVAAVNVVEISPTDRLAKLIEESKQAKVKSALDIALENTAPFRGKVISDGQVVANLEAPQVTPFQPINQTSDTGNQLVAGPVSELPAEDQPVDFILPATPSNFREGEVSTVSTGLVEGHAEEAGKSVEERLGEAFKRIEALESTVSGMHFVM